MSLRLSLLACLVCALPMTSSTFASAADRPITIASVADPPAAAGIDSDSLRMAAEEDIRSVDSSQIGRPIAISLAVVGATNTPASCIVSATVLDKRTGAMLGIAAGYASAPESAKGDPRPTVARTAVRNAVSRIVDVVVASGTQKK